MTNENDKHYHLTKDMTPEEFQRYSDTVKLINEDMKRDTQRFIVIMIAISYVFYPGILIISTLFNLTELTVGLKDIATEYFLGSTGIIAVFFGAEAYRNR